MMNLGGHMEMIDVPMKEITVHSSEQDICASLEAARLPEHMWMPVARWIKYGAIPGNFLKALLKNDLCDTINRADSDNLRCMYVWVKWIQNAAPSGCYGSVEKFDAWEKARKEANAKTG